MHRLGRNHDGYYGERINLEPLLEEIRRTALHRGWQTELIPPLELGRPAFTRKTRTPGARRLYVSTGIHGDEPAGPLAALQLLQDDFWPDADLWLLPSLNPNGLRAGTRANAEGLDINRDYRHFRTAEATGHVEWLQRQPDFDLTLLLHEDWEAHGFYTYELNWQKQPSLAPAMIQAVRAVCPIDDSPLIDGWEPSEPGIIRPDIAPADRPEWAEALWLGVNRSSPSYTLEAPSDWPLPTRVQALATAVRAAMEQFMARKLAAQEEVSPETPVGEPSIKAQGSRPND